MSFTKMMYVAIILILLPLGASGQESTPRAITPSIHIQDLPEVSSLNLIVPKANEKTLLSSVDYKTKAIPERVAKLIKESFLEDMALFA